MNVSKITIGRLYNLGNYEHVRYELTVEVKEGESASAAVIALEKILRGLQPLDRRGIKSAAELSREEKQVEEMRQMPVAEWERRYGHCQGTPSEVIARYEAELMESTARRTAALERARKAREYFDDLGGVETWKDAKLDWEDDSDF